MYSSSKINLLKPIFILFIIINGIFFQTSITMFSSSLEGKIEISALNSHQTNGLVIYNASNSYMIEKFINITDSIQNSTDVSIGLPENNWNVTRVDLEFQNISITEETIIIEDDGNTFYEIENNGAEQIAMQLSLSESTTINSIDIFGLGLEASNNPDVRFEIRGWNTGSAEPTSTVYGSVDLNISNSLKWYTQTFSTPIELSAGNYGLVIDAHNYGTGVKPGDTYLWWLNDNKTGSPLYTNRYYRGGFLGLVWDWRNPLSQQALLHRFNKWSDDVYNPSDINLTVSYNGNNYLVNDGSYLGEGNVSIEDIGLIMGGSELNLPISNNESLNLIFNLSYSVYLHETFSAEGEVEIGDILSNKWYITPDIDVYDSTEYYYAINIPESWQNVQIYKDAVNVSADANVIFENQTLFLYNGIITEGADWLISAENAPKNFTLSLLKSEFGPAEDIQISVEPPVVDGVIGLVIQDAEGNIVHIDQKTISTDNETFHYLLRSDAIDGIWKASLYWVNNSEAGFNTISFEVNVPIVIPPPDPFFILLLIILGGTITGGVIGTYSIAKARKSKKQQRKQRLVKKFKDLSNLEYIIVTDKVSSLDLFSQSFKKKELDLSLVSGFLNAIRSFGIELTGSSEQSQVIKLEYHDSKIIMSEYRQFRIILIMKDTPSHEFLETLKLTTIETDEKFGRFLKEFKGDVRPFKYVERLLIQRLETSFLYPLKLSEVPKAKLSSYQKDLLKRVKKHLKTNDLDRFKITYFIDKDAINPLDVKLFSDLIKKRIFQPIIEINSNGFK